MPKKDLMKESTGDKRARHRLYKDFLVEYKAALEEATADSKWRTLGGGWPNPYTGGSAGAFVAPADLLAEFKKLKIVRLLRKLGEDDYAEDYKLLLLKILLELDAVPPEGVFTPWRKEPGAPQIKETKVAWALWEQMGRPKRSLSVCNKLAEATYPKEYAETKLRSRARKNLRDRAWQAVQRLKPGGASSAGD